MNCGIWTEDVIKKTAKWDLHGQVGEQCFLKIMGTCWKEGKKRQMFLDNKGSRKAMIFILFYCFLAMIFKTTNFWSVFLGFQIQRIGMGWCASLKMPFNSSCLLESGEEILRTLMSGHYVRLISTDKSEFVFVFVFNLPMLFWVPEIVNSHSK